MPQVARSSIRHVGLDACVVAGLLATSTFLGAGRLRKGTAKAVITPDVHAAKVYMADFGNNRVATGVHDDLYVRCLALAAGDQTIEMCSVDLIGLFYDDVLKVREIGRASCR